MVGNSAWEPLLDGGEEYSPSGDYTPERGERQRRNSRGETQVRSKVELLPIPVHRLAETIEQSEACEQPTERGSQSSSRAVPAPDQGMAG